jgi:DNA mismatch repair protein MutL
VHSRLAARSALSRFRLSRRCFTSSISAQRNINEDALNASTMPIAALPPSTAQAIGSTSVLSDPCAVVKELLDNGLDASATSISVEISQNTIDTIQVKDNGHGIAPDDFEYVCKRAYTSKIQTLDDLRNVGGLSLGFRGEALASAAEMADTLTMTTRTKAEVVGSALKYDWKGDLVRYEPRRESCSDADSE